MLRERELEAVWIRRQQRGLHGGHGLDVKKWRQVKRLRQRASGQQEHPGSRSAQNLPPGVRWFRSHKSRGYHHPAMPAWYVAEQLPDSYRGSLVSILSWCVHIQSPSIAK